MKNIFMLFILILPFHVAAGNTWYFGKVKHIETLSPDGSFIVYLENNNVKESCLYDRVKFTVSDMGLERTKAAFSLALAAFSSDKEWGVVLNLDGNNGGACYASSTASQGAGIRH